jgi:tubulin--tyrosine ligase
MFHFAPEMGPLVDPPIDSLPFGTDAWAVHHAKASVTPLKTCFAEAEVDSFGQSFVESETVTNGHVRGGKAEQVIGRPWKL